MCVRMPALHCRFSALSLSEGEVRGEAKRQETPCRVVWACESVWYFFLRGARPLRLWRHVSCCYGYSSLVPHNVRRRPCRCVAVLQVGRKERPPHQARGASTSAWKREEKRLLTRMHAEARREGRRGTHDAQTRTTQQHVNAHADIHKKQIYLSTRTHT